MAKQALSKAALTRLSWVALIVGVLVVVLSALADPLGLGQSPGFGWKQTVGVIVGLLSLLFGFRWRRHASGAGEGPNLGR